MFLPGAAGARPTGACVLSKPDWFAIDAAEPTTGNISESLGCERRGGRKSYSILFTGYSRLVHAPLFVDAAHCGRPARLQNAPRWNIVGYEFTAKFRESAGRNMRANFRHQAQVHVGIMHTHHPQPQDLVHVQQVTQICPAEMAAGKAVAAWFDWTIIGFVEPPFDTHGSFFGESRTVAGHPSRKHAVKHIDSTRYQFHQLRRRPEAHGVSGLILRKEGHGMLHGQHHLGLGFADPHTTHGTTAKF